ncbi:MAG: hypothetical protein FJZ43_04595 [Candidatus Staskawiczbacteria bacterium]|nr:hypothetical protein [Candidatus Staskawiczbacteria bacterium]
MIPSVGWIWFIWCIYAFSNTLIQGLTFKMLPWQFFNHLITPLVSLILAYRLIVSSLAKRVFRVFIYATIVNLIVYGFFTTFTYFDGEGERLGNELINSNTISQELLMGLIIFLIAYLSLNIKYSIYVILSLFILYVILQTGSRTGAVIGGGLFLLGLLSNREFKMRSILPFLLLLGIMIYGSSNILSKNFLVFDRLSTTKEEGEIVAQTGTFLDNLGSRAIYYVYGYDIFLKNSIFGVGLNNYRLYNPISDQPNHVEVMVQLSELGIIGFLLFIMFFFTFIKLVVRFDKKSRMKYFLVILAFLIFANCFSFWIYNQQLVFATIGLICGLVVTDKSKVNYLLLRK